MTHNLYTSLDKFPLCFKIFYKLLQIVLNSTLKSLLVFNFNYTYLRMQLLLESILHFAYYTLVVVIVDNV